MDALDWLLEDDAPGVQYLARARLLGESTDSRRMKALRRRCNDDPPVSRMLSKVGHCIAKCVGSKSSGWDFGHNYNKYRGAYWTLIFLADMHADGRDPRIARLADHVLATQLENGGFSPSGTPRYEIVCLTANLLRALVHFGFGGDARVIRGYRRLAERIVPHGGVPCIVLESCLHTACKMTLAQTMRCLAAAPPGAPKSDMKKLRDVLVKEMLGVRVYQYVRPDVKAFYAAIKTRPQGMTEKEVRLKWLGEHKVLNSELLPKPGWLRFGFPRSYNPDLLEAVYALAELGVRHDPAMDDALDHIEKKRLDDGRWKMDDSLNGKMLADIERKGKPSKWITLRALTAQHHFGRVRVQT